MPRRYTTSAGRKAAAATDRAGLRCWSREEHIAHLARSTGRTFAETGAAITRAENQLRSVLARQEMADERALDAYEQEMRNAEN